MRPPDSDELDWPHLLCSAKCMRRAECLYEGDPFCLDCVELIVERLEALAINRAAREWLPPLFGRDDY